jgi:hypothetical protein
MDESWNTGNMKKKKKSRGICCVIGIKDLYLPLIVL